MCSLWQQYWLEEGGERPPASCHCVASAAACPHYTLAPSPPARPLPTMPPYAQVRGFLEQGHNRFERPLLHGHWDSELYADMPDGSTVLLWRKNPPPPDPTRYNLTAFRWITVPAVSHMHRRTPAVPACARCLFHDLAPMRRPLHAAASC